MLVVYPHKVISVNIKDVMSSLCTSLLWKLTKNFHEFIIILLNNLIVKLEYIILLYHFTELDQFEY